MFGLLVWQFVSSPEWNLPVSSPSLQSCVGQRDDILEVLRIAKVAKPTVEIRDKVRLNLEKFVWSSREK